MSEDFSIERVQDRLEIQHRVHQFCRAIDRLQLESLHDVFHEDAHHNHGVYKGDINGFIEFTRERHKAVPYSSHHVGNTLIEFADRDNAFVETYFLIWQSVTPQSGLFTGSTEGGQAFEVFSSGRYIDHFSRKNGRWAIQDRTVVPGATTKMTDPAPPLGGDFAQATRDENDPALRLRELLNIR